MLANRTIVWIGRVISILLSLLFAMSAFMKMKHGPERDARDGPFGIA